MHMLLAEGGSAIQGQQKRSSRPGNLQPMFAVLCLEIQQMHSKREGHAPRLTYKVVLGTPAYYVNFLLDQSSSASTTMNMHQVAMHVHLSSPYLLPTLGITHMIKYSFCYGWQQETGLWFVN